MGKYLELKNKKVFITGGTQGIGESMAEAFSLEGANVIINGRTLNEKVKKVAERIGADTSMGSLGSIPEAKRIINDVYDRHENIDVLICNAAGMKMAPFLEEKEEDWRNQIDINLTGHIAIIQETVKRMKETGGTIIIVSSFFGTIGWKNASGYGASKSGLLALGQYLAKEYEKYNINVGIIIPGVIETPQLEVDAKDLGISFEEVCEMYAETIPMERVGQPDEVAELALFMSTEVGGKALSGRHIQVSGGEYRTTPYYV